VAEKISIQNRRDFLFQFFTTRKFVRVFYVRHMKKSKKKVPRFMQNQSWRYEYIICKTIFLWESSGFEYFNPGYGWGNIFFNHLNFFIKGTLFGWALNGFSDNLGLKVALRCPPGLKSRTLRFPSWCCGYVPQRSQITC